MALETTIAGRQLSFAEFDHDRPAPGEELPRQGQAEWEQQRQERLAAYEQEQAARAHIRFVSVCSLGSGRWYWVVWTNQDSYWNFDGNNERLDPLGSGYASDKPAAERAARDLAGVNVEFGRAYQAERYHREGCVKRRMQTPSAETAGAPLEFLHAHYFSDCDGMCTGYWASRPHRVVKKTAKRIYIDSEPYREGRKNTGTWYDYDVESVVIDRAEFEREGHAQSKALGWWYHDFYPYPIEGKPAQHPESNRPADAFVPPPIIDALAVFGLTFPCTERDLKRSYRRAARASHPDAGGDHEAFILLRRNYEQALAFVREAFALSPKGVPDAA